MTKIEITKDGCVIESKNSAAVKELLNIYIEFLKHRLVHITKDGEIKIVGKDDSKVAYPGSLAYEVDLLLSDYVKNIKNEEDRQKMKKDILRELAK